MSSFKINRAAVRRLLYSPQGEVYQHFDNIAENTRTLAVINAPNSPYSSGTMRNSLSHETKVRGPIIVASAGILKPVVEPFRWYDSGRTRRPMVAELLIMKRTYNGRIKPKKASALRFGTPGARGANFAGIVYADSTLSAAKNDFLVDSFRRASPYPVVVTR